MDAAQTGALIVATGSTLGVILAYFKYKPGQREKSEITVAQANMNIAQGTLELVTTELEDQFRRMSAEMAEMRREAKEYRDDTEKRLAELAAELRAEKAEKSTVKRENARLLVRVADLEEEVSRLKGRP